MKMAASVYINRNIPEIGQLPLLRMRNVAPVKGCLSSKLQRLERIGLPVMEDPSGFVPKVEQIEQELGTPHAAIVTFASAFGADVADTIREVERFEDMRLQGIPEEVYQNQLDFEALFGALAPMLIFAEPVDHEPKRGVNFFQAFEALEHTFSSGSAQ